MREFDVAEFTDPDWGDEVNSGIGLSYRPARLHRLAEPLLQPMRTKAGGLDQHGSEGDSPGVILYVMDGLYSLTFPYRTGCPDRSCFLSAS